MRGARRSPIVGAINGVAAGAGASLAIACDIRLAAESASFALAFGRVGLVPDSGATWLLPRLVGVARAAELAPARRSAAGGRRGADRPRGPGRAGRELLDRGTGASPCALAAAAPRALALTKRALRRAQEAGLEAALDYEALLQDIAGRTADHAEGLAAFVEKRPPRFTGS